ncbi:MAG: DUF3344 domain-containing protein [Methanomicrobia archaeon]|nr:DUF3344 domain-containing protein [Methanomicrobia archaeon]
MNKIAITTIVAIVVLYVCSCTPALADYNFDGWPVETRLNGTVNGGVFIDYVPWDGSRDLSLTTTMPNGTVKWAYLYTGIWGGRESYKGWVNVTFNGVADQNGLGPIHLQGEDDTNQHVWCTSHGKYWMFYNVTGLVDAGTSNTARVRKINETYGAFDGRVYGIVLIAIYEDGDNPKNIQYWINDGNDAFHYAEATWPPVAHDTGTTYFNGTVDVATVTRANLTVVHLTAYDPSCSSGMTFNDHPLNTNMLDTNTFELNTWDVSSYVTASENLVWFTRCEDTYINVPLAILTLEKSPDLIATAIKPYHYEWSEEYNCSKGEPWFNLTNYVNVTVYNNGTGNAGPFAVMLYANETQIGAESVNGLSAGAATEVKFEWKPEGEDPLSWIDTTEGAICAYTDTSKEYVLRAVVDGGDEVSEENEENNELTKEQKVVWNGFTGDEPLENSLHGNVNGGIIYTTGDGQYRGVNCYGTKYGTYYDVNYDLALPGNVTVARLYLYYTWAQPSYTTPKIGIKLKDTFGTVHTLSMEQSYNDIKGDFDAHRFVWGTYVFNITNYINKSGTYTVNITNLNDGGDSDFATDYAFAAPAMLVVYENSTMPEREYWLTEGADILLGGRRSKGGFLELSECRNTARFLGDIEVSKVKEAKLGVVAPWAGVSWEPGMTTYMYFNDVELGRGVYSGYGRAYNISTDGITMMVGADDAQIGVNVTDVTAYLNASANEAIQGDDGDCMMPSSAILLLTQEEDILDTGLPESRYPSISGIHNGSITVDTNITVSSLYTYQCPGTGGHTEFIRIWNETTGACVKGHWDGYQGDYQTISLNRTITLKKGVTYHYTIQTGSYPQIHHQKELPVDGGIVTCEKFTDANGREYDTWIPAFILY